MSEFTKPLTVTYLPDTNEYRVERAFKYYIGEEGSDEFVQVPVGYTTDFASTPKGFRWLAPKTGRYNQATVVHDIIFEQYYEEYTNMEASRIFLEAMEVLEVSRSRRWLMFVATVVYGTFAYPGRKW
jgi:hypothetical protein